jgi:hypothetical protein
MKTSAQTLLVGVFCWVGLSMTGGLQPAAAQDETADAADRKARPCEYDERYRAFDFWIGHWEVANAQGQVAGTNLIEKAEQGCLLLERWTGRSGGTGTSMNFYDPAIDKWVQVWVSAGGVVINIEGGLEDGSMVLVGTLVARDGTATPFRGTWTPLPDGRVRQFFEQSTDDGKTWTPWFDGYYTRKEGAGH